ncbi:MAG: hypothetical protein ACLQVY_14895 [Limisphaerales bacterium]
MQFAELPKKYSELCQLVAPRVIHKKAELKKISEITEAMAGQNLSQDQTDYFDLLCRLIEDYQRQEKERLESRQKRGNPARLAKIRQRIDAVIEVCKASANSIKSSRGRH